MTANAVPFAILYQKPLDIYTLSEASHAGTARANIAEKYGNFHISGHYWMACFCLTLFFGMLHSPIAIDLYKVQLDNWYYDEFNHRAYIQNPKTSIG